MMVKYMTICPHDDTPKNKANWIDLVVYISQRLDNKLAYLSADGSFNKFRTIMHDCAIVYANPIDAYTLWKAGFEVVAGNDLVDASYIVKKINADNKFEVVFSVNNTYAHILGLYMLLELFEDLTKVKVVFKDSWEACAREVLNSSNSFSILYKDYFDNASKFIKSQVEVVSYKGGNHSHYIMVNPRFYKRDDVLEVIMNMPSDEEGREIMKKININQWNPKDDLNDLEEELKEVRNQIKGISYIFG